MRVKRKRHLHPPVAIPRNPRGASKGSYDRKIIAAMTVSTDLHRKREYHLHATKGWRSYRPEV